MREFLTFFLKKRAHIISKVEELKSSVEVVSEPAPNNEMHEALFMNPNPFNLPIIPDIDLSKNKQQTMKLSQLLYLRIMTEIFLFHALVILVSESNDELNSGEILVLRNELHQLIIQENVLPLGYCQEVLFAHEMHEEAFMLMFHKAEYQELYRTIRIQIEAPSEWYDRQYWVKKLVKYARKINGKIGFL